MRFWIAANHRRIDGASLPALAFIVLALTACEKAPGTALATIDEITPRVLEPGDILRITGSGFVEGPARITLRGTFDPVGLAPPQERSVPLEANAVSATWIEVPITERVMSRLTDNPVKFKGVVDVHFPKSLSIGSVRIGASSAPLSIEIRPAGGGVETASKRLRDAERFLGRLGLDLAGQQIDDLLVRAVEPESPADRVGIEPGDRLLSMDGSALAAVTDLAGVERRDTYKFEIISEQGDVRSLTLATSAGFYLQPDELAAMLFTSLALGLFVAFAAPRRGWRDNAVAPGWDPLTKAIALAGVTVVMVAGPAVVVVSRSEFFAAGVLLATYVAGIATSALYGPGKPRARFASALAHLLPVPLFMTLPAASGSMVGFWSAVADQRGTPLNWNAWSSPFAMAMLVAATALIWPSPSKANPGSPIARAAAWTAAISGATALTAYGLGGWNVPGLTPSQLIGDPLKLLAGVMIFAFKAWIVLHAARWFASAGAIERRADDRPRQATRLLLGGAALLCATITALLWEWADLPADLRSAGQLSAAGFFITLVTAFVLRKLWGLLPQRQS